MDVLEVISNGPLVPHIYCDENGHLQEARSRPEHDQGLASSEHRKEVGGLPLPKMLEDGSCMAQI
ncbi:hypothetical protein Pyn_15636 [Prunus yedoensis var. nudiflora]|uniref:Uncharacterized protein n=1 Tax=Prunus yedoensis var. nudiflora TaxID=2094558 RepID=A0A314Z726_PRUYE|nr:hypothetical protein Pyn_15636 [Prunus yedoensis var. nudiflora]